MSPSNCTRVAVIGLACLFFISVIHSQGTAPAQSGPSRIAIVNIQQAISATAEGKQAAAELDAQFAPRQQELETLTKQVEDIRKRMDATSTSADERKRLNLEGTRLNQRLEQKSNELNEDMNAAQVERVNEIGRKLLPVINQFGTDGGYTAVLDSSAQNSPVLFAAKNADVTPDIIRLYDQANPANAGTPALTPKPSSPSAPKP